MLCSECKKNAAILFYNKVENGKETMEGLCYDCAKKKGINPLDVLSKQSDLLNKDKINLNDMSKQLEIIFNEKDKADLYISRILETKKKLPLSDLTEEKISEYISQHVWTDDGISEQISGYTKDVPVTLTSVADTEVNGIKMKKFEGKLTLAKSSSDTDTTWDCYIYGYVLEAGPNTVGFFGLEQEKSQPADKIELIKKNMDAMVKTIKLI